MHYPVIPSFLLRDRWPSLERVVALDTPTLFIAGGEDRIVPASQTRSLYEIAREPKRLLIVDGADHNDPVLLHGNEVMAAVHEFLTD